MQKPSQNLHSRRFIFIVSVVLFFVSTFVTKLDASTSKLDSLHHLLLVTEDLESSQLLNQIGLVCKDNLDCYNATYKVIRKLDLKFKYELDFVVAVQVGIAGDNDESIRMLKNLIQEISNNQFHTLKASATCMIGERYIDVLKLDSAMYYFKESIIIYNQNQETYYKWRPHFFTAKLFSLLNEDKLASDQFDQSYEYLKTKYIASDVGYWLYEVARWYQNRNIDKYLFYVGKYGEYLRDSGKKPTHFGLMNLLQTDSNKLKNMEIYIEKSYENKDDYFRAFVFYELGNIYYKNGNYLASISNYESALKENANVLANSELLEIYEKISDSYFKIGKPSLSVKYLKSLQILKDSIHAINTRFVLTDLQSKFNENNKDKIIAEQELQAQTVSFRINLLFYGVTMLLLLTGIFVYLNNERKDKKIKEQNQKLKDLETEHKLIAVTAMLNGVEKERQRVSQELHDGIGSAISNIKARLQTLPFSAKNFKQIKATEDIIDNTYEEIRRISKKLMPRSLEVTDFESAIRELLKEFSLAFKNDEKNKKKFVSLKSVDIVLEGNYEDLEEDYKITLYRILQEIFTNIRKHSFATNVLFQLIRHSEFISLLVEDNGVGFSHEKVDLLSNTKRISNKGLGLSNINYRVMHLNGTLSIETSKGLGTSFNINVPIPKNAIESKKNAIKIISI